MYRKFLGLLFISIAIQPLNGMQQIIRGTIRTGTQVLRQQVERKIPHTPQSLPIQTAALTTARNTQSGNNHQKKSWIPHFAGTTGIAAVSVAFANIHDTDKENSFYIKNIIALIDLGILPKKTNRKLTDQVLDYCFANHTLHTLDPNFLYTAMLFKTKYEVLSLNELNYYCSNLDKLKLLPYQSFDALLNSAYWHKEKFPSLMEAFTYYYTTQQIQELDFALTHLTEEEKKFFLQTDIFTQSITPTSQQIKTSLTQDFKSYRNYNPEAEMIYRNIVLNHPETKELAVMINDFSHQKYQENKITFFHGQSWKWNLYETVFNRLTQYLGKEVQETFKFPRYTSQITQEQADRIHRTGVNEKNSPDREHILFTNLCLFDNRAPSNSMFYFLNNFDQKHKEAFDLHSTIEGIVDLFKQYDLEQEARKVISKNKSILKSIFELHQQASPERGTILSISIPEALVPSVVYSTYMGPGYRGSTEVAIEAAKNWSKKYKYEEYVIVLGPLFTSAQKAKEEGIEIHSWNVANPDLITKRDKLIDKIIQEIVKLKKDNPVTSVIKK